jgi:hypothetical protein
MQVFFQEMRPITRICDSIVNGYEHNELGINLLGSIPSRLSIDRKFDSGGEFMRWAEPGVGGGGRGENRPGRRYFGDVRQSESRADQKSGHFPHECAGIGRSPRSVLRARVPSSA